MVTPLEIVVDEDAVTALRAEDASGGFGILPGHADFLTSLAISVIGWQKADGVLAVTAGRDIAIATREAIRGDDLVTLDQTVLSRFRADTEAERADHADSSRPQLDAIRQIVRHLGAADRYRPGMPG